MKTVMSLEVSFDPTCTDPEALATALDVLIETALSMPGVLDDYGPVALGSFSLANGDNASPIAAALLSALRRIALIEECGCEECASCIARVAINKATGAPIGYASVWGGK